MHQRLRGAFPALLTIAISTAATAQRPRLQIEPRQPSTGTLTRLTIDRLPSHGSGDSILRVTGTMAGEPLHFRPLDADRLQALGAIPIEASDSVVAQVVVEHRSGALDSLRLSLKYPHQAPPVGQSRGRPARASRLRVDPKFTRRLDAETEARIERENELARTVGHRAQDTPQLWTEAFARPRQSKVTSRFGTGRVFNGRVSSSHLGVDYRGTTGDPIYAANRGVVALVDSFFLAGNVVYIDHGDGIVTGYFHMSLPKVAVGDTVERGQEIGLVGATGRVTAAHLHWSARFGALTIDPGNLLSLGPPFVPGKSGSRATGAHAP